MSPKKNIICVSNSPWDTNFLQSTKQLISLVARDNRVLYVDYPYTLKDLKNYILGKKKLDFRRIIGFGSRVRIDRTEYKTAVYILSIPPILSINWIKNKTLYDFFNKINCTIISNTVRKYQKKLGFNEPVVINAWSPISGTTMYGKFNEKLLLYYCYDEISAGNWVKKHGKDYEDKFLSMVSGVIVSSKELKKTKSLLNPSCYLVPNGVNFKLFRSYQEKTGKAEIEKIFPKYSSVVGYVGTIDERLDTEMLNFAFASMPESIFVFIGRITNSEVHEKLSSADNVLFIDPVTPEELPKHIHYFSVGIIPFVKNKFTSNIYPMKINEYLAMGKPVVLTEFSELDEFKDLCSFAMSNEEFVSSIKIEISTDNEQKINSRIAVAAKNSWEHRAAAFSDVIDSLIA